MIRLKIPQQACENCGRMAKVGLNRPHSLHRTKRVARLNLQRKGGRLLCTRCLRTLKKQKALTTQKALA